MFNFNGRFSYLCCRQLSNVFTVTKHLTVGQVKIRSQGVVSNLFLKRVKVFPKVITPFAVRKRLISRPPNPVANVPLETWFNVIKFVTGEPGMSGGVSITV